MSSRRSDVLFPGREDVWDRLDVATGKARTVSRKTALASTWLWAVGESRLRRLNLSLGDLGRARWTRFGVMLPAVVASGEFRERPTEDLLFTRAGVRRVLRAPVSFNTNESFLWATPRRVWYLNDFTSFSGLGAGKGRGWLGTIDPQTGRREEFSIPCPATIDPVRFELALSR